MLLLAAFGAAVAAAWLWSPLGELRDVDQVAAWLSPLRDPWWGAPAIALGIALSALFFVPLTPMVMAAVLTFGSVEAFAIVYVAAQLSAAMGHTIGRHALGSGVQRRLQKRVTLLSSALNHPVRATILMRLVPVAPFTLVNVVAGSSGLRFWPFMLGSVIGEVPMLALVVFASGSLLDALRHPSPQSIATGVAVIAVAIGISLGLKRWLGRTAREHGVSLPPPS